MLRFVFFALTLFYGCGRIHSTTLQSQHHTFFTRTRAVIFSILFASLHSIRSFLPLLSLQKKLHFAAKKRASPALNGWHPQPSFASLHCGLFASATLAPLAVGSRLMQQPKNALRYRYAAFLVLRSRLFYLRCFGATPTPTPDHPPLKQVKF
jgi:hypothetical protein